MPSIFDPPELDFYTPPSPRKPAILSLTTIGDLLTEPEEQHSWVVDQLLIRGGCSLLVGKPKAGKSVFTRSLALAVARGELFLGRHTVSGRVVVFAMEEKRNEVRRHFAEMGAIGDEEILLHVASAPANPNQCLRDVIERHAPALIVIDTLLHWLRGVGDINDYVSVHRAMEPIVAEARMSNCHVMLTHHLGKQERGGGDGILGSTALFAAVDAVLVVDRDDQRRTLRSVARYGQDLERSVLTMDEETGQLCLGVGVADEALSRIQERILQVLDRCKIAVTEKELDTMVEGRIAYKRRALRCLVAEGRVERAGGGRKGDVYRYSCSRLLNGNMKNS